MAGGGGSQTSQTSESFSQAESFVDPRQQPFLSALYSRANQFGGDPRAALETSRSIAPQLFEQGLGALQSATSPQATNAGIEALTANLLRTQSQGLNEIQNRFGTAGTTGSRAAVTGEELTGRTTDSLATGIAQLLGDQSRNNIASVSQLPALLGVGTAGESGGANVLQQLAQILGDPTILNRAESESTSTGGSKSTRLSFFGG